MLRAPSPRAAVAALALGACLLALAGCAKTPPASNSTGVGTLGTAAPTRGSTSAAAPPTASAPTTAPAPTYPTSAEDYAKAAIAAWAGRDLTRLDQLEVQSGELHTLYQCNGCYDIHFALVNCQGAAGSSYCLFFNSVGDSLRLRLVNQFLGQPRAIDTGSIWDPIAFPTDDKAYAQEALNAWQAGNDNRLKLLTANQLASAGITALGADPSAQWTFARVDGAAGSLYYIWSNGAHQLAFRFINSTPAPTTGPNSQHRIVAVVYTP